LPVWVSSMVARQQKLRVDSHPHTLGMTEYWTSSAFAASAIGLLVFVKAVCGAGNIESWVRVRRRFPFAEGCRRRHQ
jgi:hypothetical protein